MSTDERRSQAERRFLALLADQGLPTPSTIEHKEDSIEFRWDGPQVAVVVALNEAAADAPEEPS